MKAVRQLLGDLLYWGGILAGSLAILIHLLLLSVFTPGKLPQATTQILASPAVQRACADSLVNALAPIAAAQGTTISPAQALTAVHLALSSPIVQHDFLEAMTTAQERLLGQTTAPVVIGGPVFTHAVAAALDPAAPQVARALDSEDLAISIPGADVPNLGLLAHDASRTEHTLTSVALLFLVLALVIHHDRRRLLGRIGTWLVGSSIAEVVLFWFLPHEVLPHIGFSWAQVAAVVLQATGAATVTFFLELFALGAGAIALARGAKALV